MLRVFAERPTLRKGERNAVTEETRQNQFFSMPNNVVYETFEGTMTDGGNEIFVVNQSKLVVNVLQ